MSTFKIYCCGDSFTDGTELVDHLLPGYPGLKATNNLLVNKDEKIWSATRFKEGRKYFGTEEKYRQTQKDAAWPGRLLKLDNRLSVINGSRDGISIVGIANRTLIDLMSIYNRSDSVDVVFIQLTSPTRLEIYNQKHPDKYFMNERTFGWIDTFETKVEQHLGVATVKHYSVVENSIKYLYNMCMIKNAVKGITGTYPVFLGSYAEFIRNVVDPLIHRSELINNDTINCLLSNSGILNIPDDDIMSTIHEKNQFLYTPISHFEQRTHDLYANHIYNKYIK